MTPNDVDPRRSEVGGPAYPRPPAAPAPSNSRALPPADSLAGRIVRYGFFALALAVLGVITALAVGASLGDRFSATSQVLVRPPVSAQTVVTGNPGTEEDIQRVVDTDLQIAQSRDFLSRVASRINNRGVTVDTLSHDLTITTTGDADLIAFTASEPDASSAQAVATTAATELVSYLKARAPGDLGTSTSQDPGVIAAQLRQQLLQTLQPAATIVSPASSAIQVRPNHSRDALIGLTGGLVVAVVGIALGETVLNRRRVSGAASGTI
jgi:capsular polysaccharide biosynthesis protein